jgi:HEPN domain-containing protein
LVFHDLLRLAQKADVKLTEDMEDDLDMITTFNINARYDNYKQEFYNRCTKEFTDLWKQKIENLRQKLITLFKG